MLIRRIRLVLVVVTLVVFQTTVFPHLRVFDAMPDLALVATVAIAYEEGPQSGLIFGFVSGLAIDLFLSSPAGLSALAFALTGWAIGISQSAMFRESRSLRPALGFIGGLFGGTIFVMVGAIAGEDQYLSIHSVQIVIVAALYDALLAYLIFPFVRWGVHDPYAGMAWRRR